MATKATKSKLKFTPFVILIDDREGLPYAFQKCDPKDRIVMSSYRRLATGDYTLLGHESEIMIERKSLSDLFSTLGQERERFENEFIRMANAEFAAVVVEASLEMIQAPAEHVFDWRSKLHPNSVVGTITSWQLKYPYVHWNLCGSRVNGEQVTFDLLRKFFEHKIKGESQ